MGVTVRVRGVPFFFDGPMLLITAAMLATLNYQHGGKRRVKAPDVEGLPETEPHGVVVPP